MHTRTTLGNRILADGHSSLHLEAVAHECGTNCRQKSRPLGAFSFNRRSSKLINAVSGQLQLYVGSPSSRPHGKVRLYTGRDSPSGPLNRLANMGGRPLIPDGHLYLYGPHTVADSICARGGGSGGSTRCTTQFTNLGDIGSALSTDYEKRPSDFCREGRFLFSGSVKARRPSVSSTGAP
jgi:hypothetical protein